MAVVVVEVTEGEGEVLTGWPRAPLLPSMPSEKDKQKRVLKIP
jgi:hypothetical protein